MFTASDVIYSSPHCIIDPTAAAETSRLWLQHTAIYSCLNLLPLLPPDVEEQDWHLLDLACGTGDWLFDAAFELPASMVIGIDPNVKNIDYAHAQARVRLRHNISCELMDLKGPLTLPRASFDLIYGHFLSAWLTEDEWLPLLTQCRSLLRPNGVLRLVEATAGHCSSSACEQLSSWYEQALVLAGVRPTLGKLNLNMQDLLSQAGYQQITEQVEILDFSVGCVAYHTMQKVILTFFALVQPFVVRSGLVTEKMFEELYWLMYCELNSDDFSGCWHLRDLQARLC